MSTPPPAAASTSDPPTSPSNSGAVPATPSESGEPKTVPSGPPASQPAPSAAPTRSADDDGASRAGLPRGKVAVVLAGFPNPFTSELARAALRRGHLIASLGLGVQGFSDANFQLLPSLTTLTVIDASQPDSRAALERAVQDFRAKEGVQHVLGIDCGTEPHAVGLFNALNLPFVHHGAQATNSGSLRLIEETQRARTPSVISPWLSRSSAQLQLLLRSFAKGSPGLFQDWRLSALESLPPEYAMNPFSRDAFQSFATLTNRSLDEVESELTRLGAEAERGESKSKTATTDTARARQTFRVRDGSGSSELTLTFRQDSNGDPDAVMDMAEFLLRKLEESLSSASHRIWTLEDWAHPLTFTGLPSSYPRLQTETQPRPTTSSRASKESLVAALPAASAS